MQAKNCKLLWNQSSATQEQTELLCEWAMADFYRSRQSQAKLRHCPLTWCWTRQKQ